MCLLLTGKSNAIRAMYLGNPFMIQDVYSSNSDGVGIMYAAGDGKTLQVEKALPQNVEQATDFIKRLPDDDRELAMHWRMKTHGNIDLSQCHPYKVEDGTWLMHNGILHTGNKADVTKSDTWHFIADYLSGLSIDALHHPGVAEFMGEFIGSNRFAIMSGDGRLTVINKDQGIEHDGIWFSNTYAWMPELFIPTYSPKKTYSNYGGYALGGGHYQWPNEKDDDRVVNIAGAKGKATGSGKKAKTNRTTASGLPSMTRAEFYDFDGPESVDLAIEEYQIEDMADWLAHAPMQTLTYLFERYNVTKYENTGDDTLTRLHVSIRDALVGEDTAKLLGIMSNGHLESRAEAIATSLMYYCNVLPKVTPQDDSGLPLAADDVPSLGDLDDDLDAVLEAKGAMYAG